MTVKAVWEFEADVSDIDKNSVNVPGLAQDLAKRELAFLLNSGELSAEDFDYKVSPSETQKG